MYFHSQSDVTVIHMFELELNTSKKVNFISATSAAELFKVQFSDLTSTNTVCSFTSSPESYAKLFGKMPFFPSNSYLNLL